MEKLITGTTGAGGGPRLHPFERDVLATIRARRLVGPGDRVLVALSGGPDSTALLASMEALQRVGALAALAACHVDHGLRPGAFADAAACAELCARLGIPLTAVRVAVGGEGGLQAAARRARYAALREAARGWGATRIATGHTRGDQAETVLLRLLRGAGARGLGGIPPRRGAIVRPLIDQPRSRGLAYLAARGLPWREDPSNAAPRFLRNRVRREILPLLAALAPRAEERLARTADLLRADDARLEAEARALVPEGTRAEVAALAALPMAVRRRALRRLWRAATGSRRRLGAGHVETMVRLLRRGGPWRVALPRGLEARCACGSVEVGPTRPEARPAPFEIEVLAPGRYDVTALGASVLVEAAEGARAAFPLMLRTRRPGDRFRPRGGRGGKKLKAWLIDAKVPRARRDALLLVADRSGRVLAIPELGVCAEGVEGLSVRLDCKGSPPLL
jgi:tRNA(Ile)-lysidine synthase